MRDEQHTCITLSIMKESFRGKNLFILLLLSDIVGNDLADAIARRAPLDFLAACCNSATQTHRLPILIGLHNHI